jgi:Flp pilus assembly protein TadG
LPRKGAAAVEFALLLPLLAFLFVIAIDYSRAFYYTVIINNCARNGALYLCDPYRLIASPYTNVTDAALADASDLTPTPTVTPGSGSDAAGNYVTCTVTWTFHTVTNFPGVPSSTVISRTVRINLAPQDPQ